MRYLQCKHIEIDTHNQVINRNDNIDTLQPKVCDLLLYFCLNSERVITKDELMKHVWSGTLVTENAISRTLVKVRKALGDDPKSPKFIVTVPRKGYRMTQKFKESDDSQYSNSDETENEQNNSYIKQSDHVTLQKVIGSTNSVNKNTLSKNLNILVSLLIAILLIYSYTSFFSEPPIQARQIRPLTREVSQELYPAVSPGLTYLSYTRMIEGAHKYLVIEHQKSKKSIKVTQADTDLSKLVWSNDNQHVAFLARSQKKCVIYMSDIETIEQSDAWQPLTNCSNYSNPHFMFTPDNKSLLFNDRLASANGYQIFKIDLETYGKQILNQPITAGKGNYSFDISPNGETLVMLNSEFEPVTAIYTLDIESSHLTRTGQLDYLMRSVTFNHDSQSIVHPSPHPAYELWQSTLAGEKLSVIASNTSRVKHPSRFHNDSDFLFVSYLLNRDIVLEANNAPNAMLESFVKENNSSVMDYLPALTNSDSSYAFVSKRTSGSEVYWVEKDTDGYKKPEQLTNFDQHVKLYHLTFSPSDKQLAVLADNLIYVVNMSTKRVAKLPLANISIQGLSWIDEEEILFTTIQNNRWQVAKYNLVTNNLKEVASEYYGGVFLPQQQLFALLSVTGTQIDLIDKQNNVIDRLMIDCEPGISERKINLHFIDDSLVCYSTQSKHLMSISLATRKVSSWRNLPSNIDFMVKPHGVIYTEMAQSIADVMKTVSE